MKKPLWMLAVILCFSVSTYGQDLDAKLLDAAKGRNTAEVQKLLGEGADVNAKSKAGRTALMGAADLGQLDTVRVLLEQGADVDAKDRKGATALRLAEKYKYSSIAALLRRAPRVVPPRKNAGSTTA